MKGTITNTDPLTQNQIQARLQQANSSNSELPYPPGYPPGDLRPAAVLIPLVWKDHQWHLLFIRRTANHSDPHSGQVAFPGGAADPGDPDPVATALREAYEELAIQPDSVSILGFLNTFMTVTGYRVKPVVGVLPWPYPIQPNPAEVSRAFTIPLAWLQDPAHSRKEIRSLPEPYPPVEVIFYSNYDGEVLWGASARFTRRLLEVLYPSSK